MGRFFLTTSTSTYDVLVGSGQLGLLSSVELRNELAFLKLQMELLGKYEAIQAGFVDEQLSPFLNGSVDRFSGAAEELERGGRLVESRFRTSYEEIFESRDFSNLLVDLLRHTGSVQLVYGNVERAMSRIESLAVGS